MNVQGPQPMVPTFTAARRMRLRQLALNATVLLGSPPFLVVVAFLYKQVTGLTTRSADRLTWSLGVLFVTTAVLSVLLGLRTLWAVQSSSHLDGHLPTFRTARWCSIAALVLAPLWFLFGPWLLRFFFGDF